MNGFRDLDLDRFGIARALWQMSISPYRSNTDFSCKRFVPAWTPPTTSIVSMEELMIETRVDNQAKMADLFIAGVSSSSTLSQHG